MIKRHASGKHYCDGRACGYPLAWFACDPEDGAVGEWVCLDCGASMFAAAPENPLEILVPLEKVVFA